MRAFWTYPALAATLLLLMLLHGCASSSPPSRFYVLSPIADTRTSEQEAQAAAGPFISLGPIDLPAYLDRPQIVRYTNLHQLYFDEFERWAEPLERNVSRVMAENLAIMIPSRRIVTYPWKNIRIRPKFDYSVGIDISRFDMGVSGQVILNARWAIIDGEDRVVLKVSEFSTKEQMQTDSFQAQVAAQSQALEKLSREIATAIRQLAAE